MRRIALSLLIALSAANAGDEPKVWVHAPAEDLLALFPEKGAGFLISFEEYGKLVELAKQNRLRDEEQPPLSARLVRGTATARIEDDLLRIEAHYVAVVKGDRPAEVAFLLRNTALEQLAVEDGELAGDSLRFDKAGTYMVTASLSVRLDRKGDLLQGSFRLPSAAGQTLTLELPPEVEGEVGPIVRAFRSERDGGQVVGYPDRDGVFTLWLRPRERIREQEPLLSASFGTIASIGEAQVLTSTKLELEVLRAPVSTLTLLLAPGQLIRALDGKGVKSWRLVRAQDADRLEVLLVDPLQGTMELSILAELPRGDETKVDVPVVRVPGAVRYRGSVAVTGRPEVRITALDAEGARRLDQPKDAIALFQLWSDKGRVTATVERVAAETSAFTQATLRFQESGKRLAVMFRYTIAGEPLFRLEPNLPAGWILRQLLLDGQAVEHRYEDDGRLVMVFPQGLAPGAHSLYALLDTDEVDWVPNEGAVEFPLAGLRSGLDEERGHVVVDSDSAFRVGVKETNGLETVGMAEVFRGATVPESVLYAWRFEQAGWAARFGLERHRPQIAATVVNRVRPSERLLATHATVLLDIQRTGVRELKISLPKGTGPLADFKGALIKEKRAPEAGADPETWTLVFEKRIRGEYRLDIVFDKKFEEDRWSAPFPEIAVPGAQERGFLVVHAGATTAVTVEANGLRAADVDELPVPPLRPPLEVLAYAGHPFDVTVSSRRHDPHEVVQAIALSAHIYGVLSPEGRLRCRAEYRLRNNDQPFLPFALPPKSSLVGALVDGQPTKPLVEKGWLMVPLPRSKDRVTPFLVSVIYESEVEALDDKGEVSIARPLLLIDVLKTTYTLHLPQGYELTGHDGDMVPLSRKRRETVLGDLAPLLVPAVAFSRAQKAPANGPLFFNDDADGDFRGRAEVRDGLQAGTAKLDEMESADEARAAPRERDAWKSRAMNEKSKSETVDFEEVEAEAEAPAEEIVEGKSLGRKVVAKGGRAGEPTPRPTAPLPPQRQRPERALLSLDVQFLKPDNVVRLDSLAPSGVVTLAYARRDVFDVRKYLGTVLGAAAALLLLFRPRLSLLRVFPATVLAILALHFAGLSFLSADFARGAGQAVFALFLIVLLWRLLRALRRVRRPRWPFPRKTAATGIAILLAAAGARAQEEIYVPYSGDKTDAIERVFLPSDRYHELRKAAYPEIAGRATAFTKAEYAVKLEKEELSVAALYEIVKETDDAERIPLRLQGVAVTFAQVDGEPATLAVEKNGYVLVLKRKGRHTLELTLRPNLDAKGDQRSFSVPIRPVAGARMVLTHDREGHDLKVVGVGARAGDLHNIGPVATLGATWTPETEGFTAAEAELRAHTELAVAVRDGFTALAARIRYGVAGGEVQRLRVRVGKDVVVRSAACEDLAGWEVDGDGILTVALGKPAARSVTLEIRAERPREREGEESLPEIEPLGVVRDAGVIALETLPDLKIEILEAQGLLRGLAAQAPADLAAAPDTGVLHSVHRFALRPFQLRWKVSLEETRLRAETEVDLFVAKEQAAADIVVTAEVERGPGPFEIRLKLPAGYDVEAVHADIRDWWVADGVLHLARRTRQQRQEKYAVFLRRRGSTATAFEVPAVSVLGAVRESGVVRISVADGLELEATEASGLLPENIARAGKPRWGRLRRAYRFVQVPWRLVVSSREEAREMEAIVVSRLLPLADRLRVEALLNFHVRRGLVDAVSFFVPVTEESEVLVSAPDLREERSEAVEGGRRYTLQLRSPTRGSIAAAIRYTLPYGGPVRGVEPEAAARVRRFVAVEKVPDGQVRIEGPENLESGDFDDLPLSPPGSSAETVAAVFVGTGDPFALEVAVDRHSFEEVAPAMIYRAAAQVVVARSGWTRVLVSYRVYNRTEQFLRLKVPAEGRLYSVFVAGEGVRPLVEGDALLVPLRKLAIGAPTFDVDVVYAYSGAPVGDKDFDVLLPAVDRLDVRRTTLSLYLPEGYTYSFDTKMDEVDEGRIAAGEATDTYEEIKELYAVAERGNARQAQRAFSNVLQLEEDVKRIAERAQTAAADESTVQQLEAQTRALDALKDAAAVQEKKLVENLDVADKKKAPQVQQWDVNEGYLRRFKAADNRDLEEYRKQQGDRRRNDEDRYGVPQGGNKITDRPRGPNGAVPPGLYEPADPGAPPPPATVGAVVGLGGGAGGGGGGAEGEIASFFANDPADLPFQLAGQPIETKNVQIAFVTTEGAALQPQALTGAKGRISIKIDLPREGRVFHFARLGAEGGLVFDASEEDGTLLEGLLALVCVAGAVFVLRYRLK